jgi:hypothetical protein
MALTKQTTETLEKLQNKDTFLGEVENLKDRMRHALTVGELEAILKEIKDKDTPIIIETIYEEGIVDNNLLYLAEEGDIRWGGEKLNLMHFSTVAPKAWKFFKNEYR